MRKIKQKITRLAVISDEKHCDYSCPMLSYNTRYCNWDVKSSILLDLDRNCLQWKSLRHTQCVNSEINTEN
jgi:hypothetical protein